MNTTTSLDPVATTTAVFTLLFGPTLSTYVGPYFVIIIGATIGASWSLGRQQEASRYEACKYFALMLGSALMVTVPMAEFLNQWVQWNDSKVLFAPIAMLIGAIGKDWPKLLAWVADKVKVLIDKKLGGDK